MQVTVAAVVGTFGPVVPSPIFSFDSPTASSAQLNTPRSGGASITVTGLSFGAYDFTVTQELSRANCGSSSWTSSTALRCRTPSVASSLLTAPVTVGLVQGTRSPTFLFTFDAPTASFLTVGSFLKQNLAQSAGKDLYVEGLAFGTVLATPTAALGTAACGTTAWSTQTIVRCFASIAVKLQQKRYAVEAVVTVSAIAATQNAIFSFDAVAVSGVNTANLAISAGQSVTVTGLNFGSSDFTASGAVQYNLCRTTSWSSSTSLVCLQPTCYACFLASSNDDVTQRYGLSTQVTVAAIAGTAASIFSFDVPVASHLNPYNLASTSASLVTVTGLNFGTNADYTTTIQLGMSACATASWSSVTSAVCTTAPADGLSDMWIPLTLGAVAGTAYATFSYDAPVSSVSVPTRAPSEYGFSITVAGNSQTYQSP